MTLPSIFFTARERRRVRPLLDSRWRYANEIPSNSKHVAGFGIARPRSRGRGVEPICQGPAQGHFIFKRSDARNATANGVAARVICEVSDSTYARCCATWASALSNGFWAISCRRSSGDSW